ncbi:MAG: hypothetical protein ABSF29_16485 [Tepidisphaeraceae bacterium]|jgi:hypothetical protein
MPTTLGIRRRRLRARMGIGMPGDNSHILQVARRLRDLVDAPVLGGIAVYLHGGGRSTVDLDFYSTDRQITNAQLEAAGARWIKASREHVLDGVRIHTITPEDAGVTIERTSIIDGVRVVTLKDLVAIKLLCGLKHPGRSKDLGDVEELIRSVPLDKRFAARLPKNVRSEFKTLVDAVRAGERSGPDDRRF